MESDPALIVVEKSPLHKLPERGRIMSVIACSQQLSSMVQIIPSELPYAS